ncbi:hypothetical protein PGT21_028599 [Puccinia graminis f. sp. tritici]|uniref:DUF7872 domain-containing protein n=1 Tax=Puccinia graminis f. sp. tritici TaxID=56615 RepID=A0A5B0MEL4_PUCGR|nr:hypothetical protein PGT21_028599 [Puccinia graminis f. sp. tritici]
MKVLKRFSSPVAHYYLGLSIISIFLSARSSALLGAEPRRSPRSSSLALARRSINETESPHATTQTQAHPILLTSSPDSRDACQPRTLSPSLWSRLNLDEYLLQYPGGQETSLELCSPVHGKDWYILVAAQEWNSYMNVVYQAVGFAMTMMQGIIPSMIKDLFPDKHDDWAIAKAYLTFFSSCAKVHPTEGHLSSTKWWMQLVQGQIGLAAGEANIMDYAVIPDPVNQHDKWTYFIYELSKTQDLIQSKLTQNSEEIISSGISTEQGIYGVLKDGGFLIDHVHCQSLVNLAASQQSEMKLSIQLNLLAAIWEKQKYFILRGSDPCDGDGENGASSGKNQLSYCNPDNIMMKIVQLKTRNKITSEIHNGHLVLENYNFTAQFLTERAWRCQSNTKQFEPEVWNSSKPIKIDSECSFNLAVCDLTSPETRELRKKGKSIAEICRNHLGLPI